ncbi:MAG: choice-of-anchor B family protein [Acidobacteria bacterium]|nr:choice-of-anchor B family protein [Acidobacteriota bacterium]
MYRIVLIWLLAQPIRVWSHDEDPKQLCRQPPYRGPGYRRLIDQKAGPNFPAELVQLESWLPLGDLDPAATSGNDCWGYVAPSGREYALIGTNTGTAFVEITQPGNAQLVQFIAGPESSWRDIKTYSTYAYAVSEGGGGIQIFDLRQIDNGVVTLANTVFNSVASDTHNVAINTESGFLYRCGGGPNYGLRMYSLADPLNPTFVGAWNSRYVHDAQIVTWQEGPYAGHELAFCMAGVNSGWLLPGLSIIDVTNKAAPVQIVHYQYPFPVYSHQGWLSEDRQYFYLNDELDERINRVTTRTHILDISNLAAPVEKGTFTSGSTAVDHNLYVKGSLIFEANYRSGLRIFQAFDPEMPIQIGFFDTYPDDDQDQFNGLWSNFPYFPSGTVIGSDLERGLFVWSLGFVLCDVNGDFQVNMADYEMVRNRWPESCLCPEDLNLNRHIDVVDMILVLNNLNAP